jgi:hypothetical protein
MAARFATRFILALVLGAIACATPTLAQGQHDSDENPYQRGRYEVQHDRWESRWDRDRQYRLTGRRYERMRALAHRLGEQAKHAADQAVDGSHHDDRSEGRFLNAITHFAEQAEDFHERMDRYQESPWDVPREIDHLLEDARRVNRLIHDAHAFEHTWDDWDEVIDLLVQIQRVFGDDGRNRYPFRH